MRDHTPEELLRDLRAHAMVDPVARLCADEIHYLIVERDELKRALGERKDARRAAMNAAGVLAAEVRRLREELARERRVRQPLDDLVIFSLWDAATREPNDIDDNAHAFARAIERAHGIQKERRHG